jgi:hypothetical protein
MLRPLRARLRVSQPGSLRGAPSKTGSHRGLIEALEVVPIPKLPGINPVAALDLAVLFRVPGLNVPMPDAGLLYGQGEGQGNSLRLSVCRRWMGNGNPRWTSLRNSRLLNWCCRYIGGARATARSRPGPCTESTCGERP